MALVAYDNSDSEYEDDLQSSDNAVNNIEFDGEPSVSVSTTSKPVENETEQENHTLFTQLPRPSMKKAAVVEEDDEFLHKKEKPDVPKPKAKITVPSLSDFKDVEDRAPKPKVSNGKKSGLLSMLPQPRNAVISKTTSLVPQQLTKKPISTVKKKAPLPTPLNKPKTDSVSLIGNYSDDSDDEDVQTDFFSINKPVEIPVDDVPLDIDTPKEVVRLPSEKMPRSIESYFKKDAPSHVELQPDYDGFTAPHNMDVGGTSSDYGMEAAASYHGSGSSTAQSSSDVVLDDEAIRQLCGARGKRKREDIQIVDVNQQEVLADAREWLLKGLMDDTTKRVSSSKRRGDEPTSQQRRKHQITYLAHQAKANEIDLQNQWAQNRMSKRQTQSKYGF